MATKVTVYIWAEHTDCAGHVCYDDEPDETCVVTYEGAPDELIDQALELIRLGILRRNPFLIRAAHSLTAEAKSRLVECGAGEKTSQIFSYEDFL